MIVVGGFNSSLDRLIEVEALTPGHVLRARRAQALPGGKGLHVATAIAALGEAARLVGIIDLQHREEFASFSSSHGVEFRGVPVSGTLRTCLALREDSGATTEILEPGPQLSGGEREALLGAFLDACRDAPTVVLTGSVPPGLHAGTYGELVAELRDRGARSLVDASGELLARACEARPFLIKPNREEAAALTGITLTTRADAARAALQAVGRGIELAVVSLGADGAVAAHGGAVYQASVPLPAVCNVVGAGDCLLGGLAVGLSRGWPLERVLGLGVACGTAKALSSETGSFRAEDVDALLPRVQVTRIA